MNLFSINRIHPGINAWFVKWKQQTSLRQFSCSAIMGSLSKDKIEW